MADPLLPAALPSAYIALGSNLDDPKRQVLRAVTALRGLRLSRFLRLSGLYASRPLAGMEQPEYVNAVAAIGTELTPEELLQELQEIEMRMGRPAVHERWGPRIIDLDLLVLGRQTRASASLVLPHPGIAERNFVVYPLAELAPELILPGLGRVATLKEHLSPEGLRRLPD
jgi:2-amino-4-hydroxy-6-hydroxymethyldihydropteridine diphosphokinase